MTSSILGQATLQAIKGLKESGEKSFEKLTAALLSLLIGFPIRLCKPGYQAGIDAMADPAEIPIAIEDKRYQSGSLNLCDLEGEHAAVTRTYPDIQLWVLATIVAVAAWLPDIGAAIVRQQIEGLPTRAQGKQRR